MGGARPKTIVQDGDRSYLAKFNRPDDLFNTVKVEHASMTMLKELGAKSQIHRLCIHMEVIFYSLSGSIY
ncbi:hypothetical protein P4S73_29855 [Paraglaciecola sp. Hal342]